MLRVWTDPQRGSCIMVHQMCSHFPSICYKQSIFITCYERPGPFQRVCLSFILLLMLSMHNTIRLNDHLTEIEGKNTQHTKSLTLTLPEGECCVETLVIRQFFNTQLSNLGVPSSVLFICNLSATLKCNTMLLFFFFKKRGVLLVPFNLFFFFSFHFEQKLFPKEFPKKLCQNSYTIHSFSIILCLLFCCMARFV